MILKAKELVVGKTYWSYYFEEFGKHGVKTKYHTGIFPVKFKEHKVYNKENPGARRTRPTFQKVDEKYTKNWAATLRDHHLAYRLEWCKFSEDKEEITKLHDESLIKIALEGDTSERKTIFKKLINKSSIPEEDSFEKDAKEWFKNLSGTKQAYVIWIKDYYTEYHKDFKDTYEGFEKR